MKKGGFYQPKKQVDLFYKIDDDEMVVFDFCPICGELYKRIVDCDRLSGFNIYTRTRVNTYELYLYVGSEGYAVLEKVWGD